MKRFNGDSYFFKALWIFFHYCLPVLDKLLNMTLKPYHLITSAFLFSLIWNSATPLSAIVSTPVFPSVIPPYISPFLLLLTLSFLLVLLCHQMCIGIRDKYTKTSQRWKTTEKWSVRNDETVWDGISPLLTKQPRGVVEGDRMTLSENNNKKTKQFDTTVSQTNACLDITMLTEKQFVARMDYSFMASPLSL